METLKIKPKYGSFYISELNLSPKEWEQLKKLVDKELYKKYNKYADYGEIRIYMRDCQVDVEAHMVIENRKKR